MKILKLTLIFVVVLGAIAGGFFLGKKSVTKSDTAEVPVILCVYCDDTFTDESAYKDHLHSRHLTFVCDYCSKRFESQEYLDAHLDTEHLKYPCDMCDMKFISEDELKKHNDDAHKSPVKAPIQPELKFECRCPGCDMKFSNIIDQYNHELTAHPDKIHKCPKDCGYYNFTGRADLDRHLKVVHKEE